MSFILVSGTINHDSPERFGPFCGVFSVKRGHHGHSLGRGNWPGRYGWSRLDIRDHTIMFSKDNFTLTKGGALYQVTVTLLLFLEIITSYTNNVQQNLPVRFVQAIGWCSITYILLQLHPNLGHFPAQNSIYLAQTLMSEKLRSKVPRRSGVSHSMPPGRKGREGKEGSSISLSHADLLKRIRLQRSPRLSPRGWP